MLLRSIVPFNPSIELFTRRFIYLPLILPLLYPSILTRTYVSPRPSFYPTHTRTAASRHVKLEQRILCLRQSTAADSIQDWRFYDWAMVTCQEPNSERA